MFKFNRNAWLGMLGVLALGSLDVASQAMMHQQDDQQQQQNNVVDNRDLFPNAAVEAWDGFFNGHGGRYVSYREALVRWFPGNLEAFNNAYRVNDQYQNIDQDQYDALSEVHDGNLDRLDRFFNHYANVASGNVRNANLAGMQNDAITVRVREILNAQEASLNALPNVAQVLKRDTNWEIIQTLHDVMPNLDIQAGFLANNNLVDVGEDARRARYVDPDNVLQLHNAAINDQGGGENFANFAQFMLDARQQQLEQQQEGGNEDEDGGEQVGQQDGENEGEDGGGQVGQQDGENE